MNPEYPIIVTLEDGTIWSLDDENDVACNLEWVNTDNEPEVSAVDSHGNHVRIVVEACNVVMIELLNGATPK